MIHSQLIILTGLPGVGKNYIGNLLKNHFQFILFDADDVMPEEMKIRLRQGYSPTLELRQQYWRNCVKKVKYLQKKFSKIAVTITVPLQIGHTYLKAELPEATFLLVTAPKELMIERIDQRQNHFINKFLAKQYQKYEPIPFPHEIVNNGVEKQELIRRLTSIVEC